MSTIYIKCPFCNEDDFDFPGLKLHLQAGWCEAFNEVQQITPKIFKEPQDAEAKETTHE